MELQQEFGDRMPAARFRNRFAGQAIDDLDMHPAHRHVGARAGGDGHQRAIVVERHVERDLPRALRKRAREDRIERAQRGVRARGRDPGDDRRRIAGRGIDFLV